jgi:nicotinamide-nucleotide amidase
LNVEIINTGSELLTGSRLNTHAQWLAGRLTALGYHVTRQLAVTDNGPAIQAAVRESLGRADLLFTTGGLGPTSDDLTRDLIARLLGKSLHQDAAALENIRAYFAARNKLMPERTRVQAMVPDGAVVLPNANGTAPGLAIEVTPNPLRADGKTSWLVMLPGPPRELRPMFDDQVAPLLREKTPLGIATASRMVRTTGLGESLIEERVEGPLRHLLEAGLEFSICGHPGEVEVRVTARGCGAEATVREAEQILQATLGHHVYGGEGDTLEAVLIRELTRRGATLALAESCTGGHLANRLTNVPGASNVLLAGWVTYSNAAKIKCLGVQPPTLEAHGAVSEPVAREMAEGARRESGATYALSVTGIAGPGGGSAEKPVGTVFIGLAGPQGSQVVKMLNPYDRETFKRVTSQQALDLLRRHLLAS